MNSHYPESQSGVLPIKLQSPFFQNQNFGISVSVTGQSSKWRNIPVPGILLNWQALGFSIYSGALGGSRTLNGKILWILSPACLPIAPPRHMAFLKDLNPFQVFPERKTFKIWRTLKDLNLRPTGSEPVTLSPELRVLPSISDFKWRSLKDLNLKPLGS